MCKNSGQNRLHLYIIISQAVSKKMSIQEKPAKKREKEKEELKLEFVRITNKYSLFEGTEYGEISEKLCLKFAKTKKELHKIA